MELINPGIKARNDTLSKNNYSGIQESILKAIENAGEMIIKKVTNFNDHLKKLENKQSKGVIIVYWKRNQITPVTEYVAKNVKRRLAQVIS